MHKERGFTLIELMIVVAIVGILAAVAYPSYQDHVRKGNRAAAQAFMMEVAQRQQNYLLNKRKYAASLSLLKVTAPDDVARVYQDLAITVVATPPSFTAELSPRSGTIQASDYTLCVTNTGKRVLGTCAEGTQSW